MPLVADILYDSLDEHGERAPTLVRLQRLAGQQQAVVHHVHPLQEGRVNFHLADQPGALVACGHRAEVAEHQRDKPPRTELHSQQQ